MHPPGSEWISPRASLLGIGAAVASVILIVSAGLGAATYAVRDVRDRDALFVRLQEAAAEVRDHVRRTGQYPDGAVGEFAVLPTGRSADEVHPNQLVLIQTRRPGPLTAASFAETDADAPVRGFPVGKTGFTYTDATGRPLSDVAGESGGVGVGITLADGTAMVLQDETPVRDLRPLLDFESAAETEGRKRLETFALSGSRRRPGG